jgi:hypothetical protein
VVFIATSTHIILVESWVKWNRGVKNMEKYAPESKAMNLQRHIHFCGKEPERRLSFEKITFTTDPDITGLITETPQCVIS